MLAWILEILEILLYTRHINQSIALGTMYPILITVLEPAPAIQQANQPEMSSDCDAPVEEKGEESIRRKGVDENVKLDQGDIMRTGKRPSEFNG